MVFCRHFVEFRACTRVPTCALILARSCASRRRLAEGKGSARGPSQCPVIALIFWETFGRHDQRRGGSSVEIRKVNVQIQTKICKIHTRPRSLILFHGHRNSSALTELR